MFVDFSAQGIIHRETLIIRILENHISKIKLQWAKVGSPIAFYLHIGVGSGGQGGETNGLAMYNVSIPRPSYSNKIMLHKY